MKMASQAGLCPGEGGSGRGGHRPQRSSLGWNSCSGGQGASGLPKVLPGMEKWSLEPQSFIKPSPSSPGHATEFFMQNPTPDLPNLFSSSISSSAAFKYIFLILILNDFKSTRKEEK
ncbi:hypothetical protein E2320_012529 [Naja naja]|nr:hypothetical protein E2320_012529 [Naja naja]